MKLRPPAVVALLLAAGALFGTAAALGAFGANHRRDAAGFKLSGHVTGLYPGQRKRLVIVVRNRGTRAIRVRVVTTRVRDASRACKAKNLRVAAFHGTLRVAGHRSRRIAVRASMRADSPTACQGAVFRLAFHGRATPG
jgi:hypothetical protein